VIVMMDNLDIYRMTPFGNRVQENQLPIIAGYCAVPDRERTLEMAQELQKLSYVIGQRGGSFKPRTSPDSFQGHGREGLEWLREAYESTKLPIVTEIMSPRQLEAFKEVFGINMSQYVIPQIGSRNMQNYPLLQTLANERKKNLNLTVLLKGGLSATEEEILGAIRYLGEGPLLFCLRGLQWPNHGDKVREESEKLPHQHQGSRFWVDVDHIAKIQSYLRNRGIRNVSVGYDPSHVAGRYDLVGPIAMDAVEHGADFLLIETMLDDDDRGTLPCDANQAVTIKQLNSLSSDCQRIYDERA